VIHSPAGHESTTELRVILVGPTGLDAALRRDPAIELIRSRSPLDAIGELADPIDDTSPTRSVVIVAPEANQQDPSHVRQFIDGLRLVDPHVRVLRMRTPGPRPADAALFDAEVGNDDQIDDLMAVIRGDKPRRPVAPALIPVSAPLASMPPASMPSPPASFPFPQPTPTAEPPATNGVTRPTPRAAQPAPPTLPKPEPARSEPARSESDADPDRQLLERKPARLGVGDEHLVAEVIRGRDPRPLALELLRARLGHRSLDLIPPGTAPDARTASAVPVRWGAHDFGLLVADTIPAADLQRHGDWLASWLRLGIQHAELREDAYRDPLTGAWNRRYFDRFFAAALAKSRDGRHNLTLLVFDIDDFKIYNDKFGHSAGDEILVETVRLLQSTVRPTDRVCRIGGDEFAVVFYEPTGPREAGSRHPTSFFDIAKRFQKQVWEHRFPKLGEQAPGTLTVSGGLATYPWDGATVEELLDRADKLALDSKRLGKNAITLGPGAMRACNGADKPPTK